MLRPGLFVRVRLPIGEPYRALLVAEEALGTDQGQKFVYVIDQDNKAQYRRMEVGKLQDGRRVVLKGLARANGSWSAACSECGPAKWCNPGRSIRLAATGRPVRHLPRSPTPR